MKRFILCMSTILSSTLADAATYSLPYGFTEYLDSDYVYFGSTIDTRMYGCGDYTESAAGTRNEFTALSHGETLTISGDDTLYYCCDNGMGSDGHWIAFANEDTVPSYTCATQYTWTSLGNNCFCRTQQNVTFDWCRNTNASGIISSDDITGNGCEYTSGTKCSTCTHCTGDNYKDSTGCHACPYGGKIAKTATETYHTRGKTNCYIPVGSDATDDTGTFHIYNANCYWTE